MTKIIEIEKVDESLFIYLYYLLYLYYFLYFHKHGEFMNNSINSLVVVRDQSNWAVGAASTDTLTRRSHARFWKSGYITNFAQRATGEKLPTTNLSLVFAISCKNCRQSRPVWYGWINDAFESLNLKKDWLKIFRLVSPSRCSRLPYSC